MRRRLSATKRFCRSRVSASPGSAISLTGTPTSMAMSLTSRYIALHLVDALDRKTWKLVFPRAWGYKTIIAAGMEGQAPACGRGRRNRLPHQCNAVENTRLAMPGAGARIALGPKPVAQVLNECRSRAVGVSHDEGLRRLT